MAQCRRHLPHLLKPPPLRPTLTLTKPRCLKLLPSAHHYLPPPLLLLLTLLLPLPLLLHHRIHTT